MGRTKKSPVYMPEFFKQDLTDMEYYICQQERKIKEMPDSTSQDLEEALDDPTWTPTSSTEKFVTKTCLTRIQGKHGPGNLLKHLEKFHPEAYEKIKVIKENPNQHEKRPTSTTIRNASGSSSSEPPAKKKFVQTELPFGPPRVLQLRVLISIEYIKSCCILLITEDGRPIKAVEDKAWKKILKPYLKALREANIKFKVNRFNARNWVIERAQNVKSIISKKLQNKLFHLKVDATTKHRRSFLGINAQYLNDDHNIEIVTLATEEMFTSHTAENIKDLILEVLKTYNLSGDQIYAFVSDNGANMLRTARLFNLKQSNQTRDAGSDDECDTDDDDSVINIGDKEDDEWDDFSVEEEVVDSNVFDREQLLKEFLESEQFEVKLSSMWEKNDNVISVRCAAHTLQLAIYDAWKSYEQLFQKKKTKNSNNVEFETESGSELEDDEREDEENLRVNIIDKVRSIVKKLRTSNGTILLNHLSSYLQPVLDNDTRWCSTYDMLERFVTLKGDIQELSKTDDYYHLPVSEWIEIETMKNSLYPCKKATLLLQNEKCTIRDMTIILSNCIEETRKIDHEIAKILVDSLSKRKEKMFENVSFLSSLYLDPCSKALIKKDAQKKMVTAHICRIYERILMLKERKSQSNSSSQTQSKRSAETDPDDPTPIIDIEFENANGNIDFGSVPDELAISIANLNDQTKLLHSVEGSKAVESLKTEMNRYEVENLPSNREEISRLLSQPTMDFWKKNKLVYPHLFEVSRIIHSVPVSQTSVERLFSSLDFILNKKRGRMISKIVNDILQVRSNKHVM